MKKLFAAFTLVLSFSAHADCIILGDSIAVGTQMVLPQCKLQGKGGINSWQFNKMYPGSFYADTVVISLGSNDHKYVKTYEQLFEMRQRIDAQNVYWILPAGNLKEGGVPIQNIQNMVKHLAKYYRDEVLPITRLQPDGIHPSWAGYKEIVDRVKVN
jgi:lysophospholipase L1-like esterase